MDEMEWKGTAPEIGDRREIGTVQLRVEPLFHAAMISGDLDAALTGLSPDARMVGLAEECGNGPFALRIARDRALLITETLLEAEPGWYAAGFALSSADDAFIEIALNGADASTIIAEGVTADLETGSPSAALLFAGQFALLARRGAGYRLWIERPMLAWFWAWLNGVALPRGGGSG